MALYWKGIFNDAVVKVGGTLKVQVFFIISFFFSLSRRREDSRIYLTLFIYFYFLLLMVYRAFSCPHLSFYALP